MPAKLKAHCPKCRSRSYTLTETFEEHVIFEVEDGVKPDEATDHEAGSIIGLDCRCSECGHNWRPRGATSWPDLETTGD